MFEEIAASALAIAAVVAFAFFLSRKIKKPRTAKEQAEHDEMKIW